MKEANVSNMKVSAVISREVLNNNWQQEKHF